MSKRIMDYFTETVEYPKCVLDNILPFGELRTYISATFLNGLINYVKPISCYVVNRYTREDEKLNDKILIADLKEGEMNYQSFKGTKKELIDLTIKQKRIFNHTKLGVFEDDIIIVAEIESCKNKQNKEKQYIFFWFDLDVSDCSVGRFKTSDTKEEIIHSVENWLKEEFEQNRNNLEEQHDEDTPGFYSLPLEFLNGWISF